VRLLRSPLQGRDSGGEYDVDGVRLAVLAVGWWCAVRGY
jgi:hypothetical protein